MRNLINKTSISEWDIDVSNKTAEVECPMCEEITTVDLSDISSDTYIIEIECDNCNAIIKCELDFYFDELFEEE